MSTTGSGPGRVDHEGSGRARRRAGVAVALAASCLLMSVAVPAGAAPPWKRNTTTTTTTAPTTTTTTAPTSTTTAAPTTTTTTAPTTTACGGVEPPKATGGTWRCTWHDEFDGTTLDGAKWVAQTTAGSGFNNGPECYVDDPDNISVANGVLRLTAREEAAPFTCADPSGGAYSTEYTSGMVMTYGRFSQAFGRFEVRAKLPASTVQGLQTSFWLWPDNMFKYGWSWPASGEIDIAEVYSLYNDRAIPYIHYYTRTWDTSVTNNYCLIDDVTQFHTYAVEWTTTAITVIYDGQVCLVHKIDPAAPLVAPQPFDHPFMIALTQALGQGANAFDPATTPLPAVTQVDYVRVWE